MREWEELILSHIKNMLFYLVFLNVNIYIFNTTIVMIDDREIEEAARYYCNNRYPASQDAPFIAEGFRHGAKWMQEEFLKKLWHPASEEPDKHRICLVRVVYHLNYGMLPDEERIEQSSFHDFGWYDYDFKYIGIDYDIVSYLYVDELLPKKGGNHD